MENGAFALILLKILWKMEHWLLTFKNIMENGAFAPFSIIFSNTSHFKCVKRRYYGVKG